jgi:hypothetical protein
MVDIRIVTYLKDNLKKGFDVNILKQQLIKNGYAGQDVEEAAKLAQDGIEREKKPVENLDSNEIAFPKSLTSNDNKKISGAEPPSETKPFELRKPNQYGGCNYNSQRIVPFNWEKVFQGG